MNQNDIKKRLINNSTLFKKIKVIKENYDILPDNKEHIGAYIEYSDLSELRKEFLEELIDSIVLWVYSSEKYSNLLNRHMKEGRHEAIAAQRIGRDARKHFRGRGTEELLSQGQFGELLLFHFIQYCMEAVPLLRKMVIATSPKHERFGADAIHYKVEDQRNVIILGEAKTYTSKYKFNEAFENAIESIWTTWKEHRDEIDRYMHDDFLDKEMTQVAEKYINNELENVRVELVAIITYNETKKLDFSEGSDIRKQIESIIKKKYANFDNNKIDIKNRPILNRITYIVLPIWNLDELVNDFQNML